MSFPARYQLPSYKPYKRGGSPELFENATTADFRAIANSFHAEFFAEHPDTEIFVNVVKLLLAKIYDERKRRKGERYDFQVLQKNGKEESAADLFARVAPLYESAYVAYIDPSGGDALDPKVFAPERVKSAVKGLQGVSITRGAALHGDVIGAFFEEILRSGFKQDKGMYFTHANLVWFILEALDLKQLTKDTWAKATHPNDRMPYVIDPSCGSGTFLLRAMQMMSASIRDDAAQLVATTDDERYFKAHLSDDNPNEWAKDFLFGCDPKFVMAITAKVNMVLHGDGSAHIFKWDSLKALASSPDAKLRPQAAQLRSVPDARYGPDLCEQFDVVVSNPPFGITLAPETAKGVPSAFTLPRTTSSESLFLERYTQLLKPKGRLGVVVPESLLNGSDYWETRLLLYRMFWVRAVVSLPRNLFVETPTLTSLLFAQKKEAAEIAKWDAEWSAVAAKVDTAIGKARNDARIAARKSGAAPADVEAAFLAAAAPYIAADTFIVKRGRGASVARFSLPATTGSPGAAYDYYDKLLKTGGFKSLRTRAIFGEVAGSLGYEWPVYAVDEVGFKLSKRGERTRANQLLRFVDPATGAEQANVQRAPGEVHPVIDTVTPEKVLDYLRSAVTWA